MHSGIDAGSGYVHTITGTSANVHDIVETSKLIREDDEIVYGDSGYEGINWDKHIENRKSSTRAKVEHPFLIVKNQFGYKKVAYCGISKNMNRFHILFASANLVMCFCAGRTKDFCMA